MQRSFRKSIPFLVVAELLLGVCIAAQAEAPEILVLKNGDQLTGTAKGIHEGQLTWRMPDGQERVFPFDVIDRIDYLSSGDNSDIKSADFTTDASKPTVDDQVVTADNTEDKPQKKQEGVEQTVYEHMEEVWHNACDHAGRWTKRLELGARFINGNTDNDFINLGVLFEQQTGSRFTQVEGNGQWGQSQGERNTNRWYLNSTTDFDKDEKGKWILFVTSKNRYDEFENLDYRGTFSGGIGYRFYNEKKKRLIARLGPAVTYEIFNSPNLTRTTADIFGELETRWPVSDRTQFENKTTFFPSINDVNIFRLTMNSGLLVSIDEAEKWQLKLGTLLNYNSRPNMNRQKADYTTNVSLVYTRK